MLDKRNTIGTPSRRADVPPFMVMDVMSAAARIEAAGGRVIHMEVGQPAAPAPLTAREAAAAALRAGRVSYTEALGTPSLRRRIAAHYRATYGLDLDPDRVIVTTGSSAAFMLAFLAWFEPGDRIAIANPGYPPYRHIMSALGCEAELLDIGAETGWNISVEQVLAAHRRNPLAGLLLASPANPTGTMIRRDHLAELIAAAEGEGIKVISDEIYHGLDYAFPAHSAAGLSEQAIVINSFSKYFCMTGWRIGWMVAPAALMRSLERLQQNLAISVAEISQIAAEAAFDGRAEMDLVKHGYEENRRILIEGLPKIGLDRFLPADGAFYLYADISAFADDSLAFARDMLEQAGVAATPGLDFDPRRGHRYIRFSYAGSAAEMHEAVERIGAWLHRK